MSEEQIRNATRAYLISYDEALKQTKNPNIAMQAAFVITTSIITPMKQSQSDSLMNIIGAMMVNAKKKEEEDEDGE